MTYPEAIVASIGIIAGATVVISFLYLAFKY